MLSCLSSVYEEGEILKFYFNLD